MLGTAAVPSKAAACFGFSITSSDHAGNTDAMKALICKAQNPHKSGRRMEAQCKLRCCPFLRPGIRK